MENDDIKFLSEMGLDYEVQNQMLSQAGGPTSNEAFRFNLNEFKASGEIWTDNAIEAVAMQPGFVDGGNAPQTPYDVPSPFSFPSPGPLSSAGKSGRRDSMTLLHFAQYATPSGGAPPPQAAPAAGAGHASPSPLSSNQLLLQKLSLHPGAAVSSGLTAGSPQSSGVFPPSPMMESSPGASISYDFPRMSSSASLNLLGEVAHQQQQQQAQYQSGSIPHNVSSPSLAMLNDIGQQILQQERRNGWKQQPTVAPSSVKAKFKVGGIDSEDEEEGSGPEMDVVEISNRALPKKPSSSSRSATPVQVNGSLIPSELKRQWDGTTGPGASAINMPTVNMPPSSISILGNSPTSSISPPSSGASASKKRRVEDRDRDDDDDSPPGGAGDDSLGGGDEKKRQSHIHAEQKRRNNIKNAFNDLRLKVPTYVDKPNASKTQILKGAVDFIKELSQYRDQVFALRHEIDLLRRAQTLHVASAGSSSNNNYAPPPIPTALPTYSSSSSSSSSVLSSAYSSQSAPSTAPTTPSFPSPPASDAATSDKPQRRATSRTKRLPSDHHKSYYD